MATAGLFDQQLALLEANVPHPPPSYKSRVIAQILLCCLLFALSAIYLVLSTLDYHRRGKSLNLIRLTRIRGGRIIIVNTLFVYVIIVAVSAAAMGILAGQKYRVFVNGASMEDIYIYVIQTWTCPIIGAWLYTFSTASAAIQLKTHARRFDFASAGFVIGHNTLFLLIPIVYLAVMLPLAVEQNRYQNAFIDDIQSLTTALITAASLPVEQSLTTANLKQLQEMKASLESNQHSAQSLFKAEVWFALSSASLLLIFAGLGYGFVKLLRRQASWNKHGTLRSGSVFLTQDKVLIRHPGDPDIQAVHLKDARRLRAISLPMSGLNALRNEKSRAAMSDRTALARLSRDLLLSLPCLLLEGIFFIIVCLVVIFHFAGDTSWRAIEFQLDVTTWGHVPIQLAIIVFFLFNLLVNPERYSSSRSAAEPSMALGTDAGGAEEGAKAKEHRRRDTAFEVRMLPLGKIPQTVTFDAVMVPERTWQGHGEQIRKIS